MKSKQPVICQNKVNVDWSGNSFAFLTFNIWIEPLLLQKQTKHQQKTLNLSFNLTPWKWLYLWRGHRIQEVEKRLARFSNKKSLPVFNILRDPMQVQKQTIHQPKGWNLSYLEPERQGRGMVRRVPRPLAAKDIEKKSKFNGAKSGRKKNFFRFNF